MAVAYMFTNPRYSFLDIGPLSKGHSLIIPKYCGVKLADIPDEFLADAMPVAKKIAIATGAQDYNILQNNGEIAHQVVKHVHFHVIPKPEASDKQGLVIGWPTQKPEMDELKALHAEMLSKL
ncbi:Hit family protein 1; AltName: Full=Adenosine 5'-monophosphoramidase [Serendipita indica DSM 11827]|nr:Hit family protein 1; AltName: Full=Adenosine 5'-monophosphoramidase [Serendipita indica DSM 11827]